MKRKYYSLYGRMLSKHALYDAFKSVKRNKGSAGIDGKTISMFGKDIETEISRLLLELKNKEYKPFPVKRSIILKDDGSERKLGIPSVRDRVVQQALYNILYPIFDPDFHPSSYGYRKGRSCHHAISKARLFVKRYGREWAVNMDLSKCFDTLNHDIIVNQFRKRVTDSSILNLIRQFLESGIVIGRQYEDTTLGSPQGGVISPLIANVYLDAFDKHMMNRGHRIVRYADDILVLCCSKSAAENALKVSREYLEGTLKLIVNEAKTHITTSDNGIKFLGVVMYTNYTLIQNKKIQKLKAKVRAITKRKGRNLLAVVKELNPVLRGFINYFRIANCKGVVSSIMSWIRRRLRRIQMRLWKKPKKLKRRLRQLGYPITFEWFNMGSWRAALTTVAHQAMSNKWFHEEMKLFDMKQVKLGINVSVI